MATSLDFSHKDELRLLGALVNCVNKAAVGRPYLLAGATARDLLLQYAHGIASGRATVDVDLAFLIETWEEFLALRQALIHSGDFAEIPRCGLHKLQFRDMLEVDCLPFGGVESEDRTIAWPPENDFVMTMFGFKEAQRSSIAITLPDAAQVQVVSLPALAILKLIAWSERRLIEPGKDAGDLLLILRNYLAAGNHERLDAEGPYLLGSPFDYEAASGWLLGKDMALLLDAAGRERLARIIAGEADEAGQMRLAGDMAREPDRPLALLRALEEGFTEDSA